MIATKNRFIKTFHRHEKLFCFCALALISLVTYANSLPNSFHFDDIVGIVRNPVLRDLKHIPAYFTDPSTFGLGRGREWRPILQITYAINFAIDGYNPVVFRSFNLLFHSGTAFLIFLIVSHIGSLPTKSPPFSPRVPSTLPALLCASLFAVHTANSEAVNYIWARSSVLATFFYLLAFYCYLRGPFKSDTARKPFWHMGGVLCFALGMGTKATAVTLPVTLLFYEFLFLNPSSVNPLKLFVRERRRLVKYIPALIALSLYLAVRILLLPRMFTRRFAPGTPTISSYTYLLTQFRAWVYYIKLFLWPDPLIMDYSSFGWSHSLWDVKVLLSLVLILAILVLAWRARKTHPLVSLFLFWYFIALLPEASIFPLEDAVVGYRAYPAYVGLAVVAVMLSGQAFVWVWSLLPIAKKTTKPSFWFIFESIAAVVLISLILATIIRNRDWRDEITLWTDVLTKDPANPQPYMSLGLESLIQGDYGRAREFYDKAIQLNPESSHAFILRGYLNFRQDRHPQALADLATALKLEPRSPYAFFYRGEVYRKIGESDDALRDYRAALKLMPFYTDAHLGIAMAYLDKEEIVSATDACRKVVEIDPQDRRGYDCLGTLLVEQKRPSDAIDVYKRGIKRIPGDGELWRGLGIAYEKNGSYREASEAFAKANRIMSPEDQRPPPAPPVIK